MERGAGWVLRPVRPVGVPGSRYLAGLTAASCRNVRRMVVQVNGAECGCWVAESCRDVKEFGEVPLLGVTLGSIDSTFVNTGESQIATYEAIEL